MTKPNDPAFPGPQAHPDAPEAGWRPLTKREFFSAMAMQGLISCPPFDSENVGPMAKFAVKQADALIAELNKVV